MYRYVKDAVPAMFISTLLFVFPSQIPSIFKSKDKGKVPPCLRWNISNTVADPEGAQGFRSKPPPPPPAPNF